MLLNVTNLRKTYRLGRVSVPVLRGVSLSVERGEWVALLGASGSGKSTLLHLVGGLDRPDRRGWLKCAACGYDLKGLATGGRCPECSAVIPDTAPSRIVFDGRDVTAMRQRALDRYRSTDVGFVFQFYHLLPELTVTQNVLLAAMVRHGRVGYGARRTDLTQKAATLLDAVGLSHRLGHRPVELSGGERQRVAIARALLNEPALLLADEPTGNLDKATGGQIMAMLADLRARTNQTMLMVTHDPDVAARADRIITLVDGRAVDGQPPSPAPAPAPRAEPTGVR